PGFPQDRTAPSCRSCKLRMVERVVHPSGFRRTALHSSEPPILVAHRRNVDGSGSRVGVTITPCGFAAGERHEKQERTPTFPHPNSMSPNLQQLDFENQRGSARNRRRVPVVPIRDLGWAHQPGLPTYLHLLHAFSPAANDAAQLELRG